MQYSELKIKVYYFKKNHAIDNSEHLKQRNVMMCCNIDMRIKLCELSCKVFLFLYFQTPWSACKLRIQLCQYQGYDFIGCKCTIYLPLSVEYMEHINRQHVLINSMKIVISVTFYVMEKDSKRCCDSTTPESIHTKDESKRGSAFAFIFGVN